MANETKQTNKKLNILSLFDGISCAYLALNKAGVPVGNYYSSEIDKSALTIQNHHYHSNPNYIQLGDVTKLQVDNILDTDLVVFGSPCTQLSSVNSKDRSGLEGEDSSLFFEAIRILKELIYHQPKDKKLYFLMENVASMSSKDKNKITEELQAIFGDEVQILKINSSIVAPANRRRFYWTNIPNASEPKPNDTKFENILVNGYVDRDKANVLLSGNVTLTNGIFRHYKMNMGNVIFKDKSFAELPNQQKLTQYPKILEKSGYVGKPKSQESEYDFGNGCYRTPSVLEAERLMTIPDGYVSGVYGVSKSNKHKAIGLAMTVDVIAHLVSPLG
ncbi:DNA cytosine methyltransferase [Flavobacterium aciduliphilum]|uniref:DNA (cytosine-5-)-methyltransferase n=1 Tax=Flavobacterium aciduliphilum TaxID=1101402 RepID=A0A328YR43_9FLAO|nr:DNA cytosine methyltransferase [Flavobacterium aciduliphilum]RAR72546.1 DNA (cytosine-5)-methyltransferase 3A [Flavobacterium aciduliphilum]